jgi:hypothetical protein
MCYLLMVGSTGEVLDHRSWEALEDRLALPLDKALATSATRAAFPAEDWVWLVTHRGCSCDLLVGAGQLDDIVQLNEPTRQALVHLARKAGVVRFYVRNRKPANRGHRPSSVRLTMTVGEMLEPRTGVPTNCLVELVEGVASRHLS